MTENRIYELRTKKKKKNWILQPENTKEKKNEEKPRNLWVSRKYSTSTASEFKKKKRRRAKVNKHPERDWNLPDLGEDTNLQSPEIGANPR